MTIEDISAEAFERFLEYLGQAKLPKERIRGFEQELLYSAEKYDVPALKFKVELLMTHDMKPEDCARGALMSHFFNLRTTRATVIYVMLRNKSEVLGSESWLRLRESHPEVARDVEAFEEETRKIVRVPRHRRDEVTKRYLLFGELYDHVHKIMKSKRKQHNSAQEKMES